MAAPEADRTPPLRVVLIGCGFQARRAHLPVLARMAGAARLVAVLDRAACVASVRATLAAAGFAAPVHAIEDVDLARFLAAACADALILSTPVVERSRFLCWAVAQGIPVLCDKPIALARNAAIDAAAARQSWEEVKTALMSAAPGSGVAAQRRFHPLYHRIADELASVFAASGQAPCFVQAFTNDGLWPRTPDEGTLFCPSARGGGKLINTGYHLLDIVPWLLRHAWPEDSEVTVRIQVQATTAAEVWPTAAPVPATEANVAVQMVFADAVGRARCLFQLGAMHGGLSNRHDGEDMASGRTKQELLTISQGPHLLITMRRLAKLDASGGERLGGPNHADLTVMRPGGDGGAPVSVETMDYTDVDQAPTEAFLAGLVRPEQGSLSPMQDHYVAMRLLTAVYEAMATEGVRRVRFPPKRWTRPPGR